MSDEKPIPVTHVTPEEVVTLLDYQAFLTRNGYERRLLCANCGQPAEPGTGQMGWNCGCRILAWRTQ